MFSIVYKSQISFSLAFVAHIRYNNSVNEWSAHGQSDSNLGHKGQAVADTRTKSDSNLGRKDQAVADTRINRQK